jgi:serine/threonine protein kinase
MHGRYTVVRKLAEGGMAEIFLARQHGSEGFEKPVVLKRIHSAFYADEQFRNMLVDEAHISMGLHHNNIVQVLDLGRAGGRLFLVLELVDGWDLARVLDRAHEVRQLLPPGLGLYIIAEVCRALSYAHSRTHSDGEPLGIVHRDVSPQNVLISEQGEVKLADFGIAKAMTRRDRTATGVVKGKVAFMSPEQAHGQALDERSDLFSLGTLLYLVTTGVRPFEAATDFEVIARVQKCLYRPPEQVSPEMPESLGAIIRRALTLRPEDRYRSADELLVDLESVWRADYGAPGQTELKLWLADLSRIDGSAPTGRTLTGSNGSPRAEASTPAPGDLAEGVALQLGEEGPGRGPLPEIGALEDSIQESGSRPRRRGAPRPGVTGVEATTMSDLSLPVADGDDELVDRMRGRARRRMVGTGFLVFLLLGGGATVALWRLSATRNSLPEAVGEGPLTPLTQPAPARAAPPPPSTPTRRSGRGSEPRGELRGDHRPESRPESRPAWVRPSPEEEAAEAAAREAERRRARELRWSLPSESTGINGARLPRPTPPPPTTTDPPVAPPPVGEILTAPAEDPQPARDPAPTDPRPAPSTEPPTEPAQPPPLEVPLPPPEQPSAQPQEPTTPP